MFGVSQSGYYKWLSRRPSEREVKDVQLKLQILSAHKRTRESYGVDRLREELRRNGIIVSKWKLRKLRINLGIYCKQRRKYRATTNSTHNYPVCHNLLNRDFCIDDPNKVWVSDITYISTDEGWLYLASHKDLCNGEIVGYAAGERMTRDLVIKSLRMAIKRRRPSSGLIHHSDRGSQYCCYEYQDLLKSLGISQSMSRKGDCYDNAPMESFWGILKNELVYGKKYKTRAEAINEISEYIEIFYNRQRIQARLGYLSPIEYLNKYSARKNVA